MREILFRGKRVDNGEWVEGFLDYSPVNTCFLIHVVGDIPPTMSEPGGDVYSERFEVIPETVGQYVFCLLNEAKTKVFDGDKLSLKDDAGDIIEVIVEWGMHRRQMGTGLIVDIPGFCLRKSDGTASFPIADNYIGRHDLEIMQVIGNIHDQSTLLPDVRG
jgi:hypothetical protein